MLPLAKRWGWPQSIHNLSLAKKDSLGFGRGGKLFLNWILSYFLSESRISKRTSNSAGPLGSSGAGAASSFLAATTFTLFT